MTDPFSCDPSNPSSCIDSDVMSYKCRVLNSFKLHWHKFKVQEISRTCTLSSHGFWCHFSESKTHRYRFSTRLGITNVSKITDGRRRKNEEMPRWYLQNIAKQLTIGRLKRQSEGKGNGKAKFKKIGLSQSSRARVRFSVRVIVSLHIRYIFF